MLLGPIFSVEIVTSSRRARYFIIRALYGAVLLLAFWITYVSHTQMSRMVELGEMANLTAEFFVAFAWLQLLAVACLGPAMAAGTIATERERRTIEYLFATHLGNAEIVFGKLSARLLHIFYLVLVGVPILSLAALLGGIAPEAMLVLLGMTLSTAVVITIIAITISVWSPRARDAVMRTYLVLIVLLIIPPILLPLTSFRSSFLDFLVPVNQRLLAANPFYLLGTGIIGEASKVGGGTAFEELQTMVFYHAVVSLAGVVASTLAVRWVHLRQAGRSPKKRGPWLAMFRPPVGNHAMLWKEVFAESASARLGMVGRIAVALILTAILGIVLYNFIDAMANPGSFRVQVFVGISVFAGTALACGIFLLAAARAAGLVTSEKERQCWDSLLSTPLVGYDIVLAKVLGNVWATKGGLVVLAFMWGLATLLHPEFLLAIPFLVGVYLLMATYASALGMLYSLWCRTSLRAMGATLATGIFFGGGYLFCCMPLMMTGPGPEEFILTPCIPFLMAFPGAVAMEGARMLEHESEIVVAFVLGILGYAVATVLLLSAAIGNFERFAGRTGTLLPYGRRPPAPPRDLVVTDLVEAEVVEPELIEPELIEPEVVDEG